MMYMYLTGGSHMTMIRLNIQLPSHLKDQLDALRVQGVTASGYIRWLLEREFNTASKAQKGR